MRRFQQSNTFRRSFILLLSYIISEIMSLFENLSTSPSKLSPLFIVIVKRLLKAVIALLLFFFFFKPFRFQIPIYNWSLIIT